MQASLLAGLADALEFVSTDLGVFLFTVPALARSAWIEIRRRGSQSIRNPSQNRIGFTAMLPRELSVAPPSARSSLFDHCDAEVQKSVVDGDAVGGGTTIRTPSPSVLLVQIRVSGSALDPLVRLQEVTLDNEAWNDISGARRLCEAHLPFCVWLAQVLRLGGGDDVASSSGSVGKEWTRSTSSCCGLDVLVSDNGSSPLDHSITDRFAWLLRAMYECTSCAEVPLVRLETSHPDSHVGLVRSIGGKKLMAQLSNVTVLPSSMTAPTPLSFKGLQVDSARNFVSLVAVRVMLRSGLVGITSCVHLSKVCLKESTITDSDVRLLAKLPKLTSLDISGCMDVLHLSPLASHPNLQVLLAHECRSLLSAAAVAAIPNLRSLSLPGLDRRGIQSGLRDLLTSTGSREVKHLRRLFLHHLVRPLKLPVAVAREDAIGSGKGRPAAYWIDTLRLVECRGPAADFTEMLLGFSSSLICLELADCVAFRFEEDLAHVVQSAVHLTHLSLVYVSAFDAATTTLSWLLADGEYTSVPRRWKFVKLVGFCEPVQLDVVMANLARACVEVQEVAWLPRPTSLN